MSIIPLIRLQEGEEEHSNLFGCWFKGLGSEGRKECRQERYETKQKEKEAEAEQAEADAELTKAAALAMGEDDTASGSNATPFIIGGILLAVLVIGILIIKKRAKK